VVSESRDPNGPADGPPPSGAAGVEHLQAAGREFLSAARSFLDAVEEVVEDRTRLGDLAESFTGFLGELADAARGDRTPWGRAVRVDDRAPAEEAVVGDDPEPSVDPGEPDPPGGTEDGAARPRTGRVRRIPLD